MKITDWNGCYDDNWNGSIHPLAYAHPAKYSRGLIKRIYQYLLASNLIRPGDTVVDCFGGVGLGALDAITNGLNYIGCELEMKFVDLGQGCDCTGISKVDWVRFYGRWDRANYRDGRHWCPDCLEAAKRIDEMPGQQLGLFGPVAPVASYKRNSGRIPYTRPHHFSGNIELFLRRPGAKGQAVLLQGDSRKLASVIQQAGGLVSSPPYANIDPEKNGSGINIKKQWETYRASGGGQDFESFARTQAKHSQGYGTTPGQLASLPEGKPVIVASPPYAGSLNSEKNGIDWSKAKKDYPGRVMHEGRIELHEKHHNERRYGEAPGQLGAMPEGSLKILEIDCSTWSPADEGRPLVVSSPPFAGNTGGRGEASRNGIDPALFDRHQGAMVGGIGSEGNLAGMKPGAVVSSPPFEDNGNTKDVAFWHKHITDIKRNPETGGAKSLIGDYGSTDGQLGTESGETFWSAAAVIISQCYQLLPPGAPAVWVVKSFVRDGAIVDFPGQWQQLCEACGFETVEVIRAWLVKDKGTQVGLNGEQVKKTVARKSFFRRLAEAKGSPAIDFETVLITRKAAQ